MSAITPNTIVTPNSIGTRRVGVYDHPESAMRKHGFMPILLAILLVVVAVGAYALMRGGLPLMS